MLVVAAGGVLRFWDVQKHERAPEHEHEPLDEHESMGKDRVEITCVTGALMNGTWWVWWGDAIGRVSRRNVTSLLRARALSLTPSEDDVIISGEGEVRGVTVDWLSSRLYWTTVDSTGGSVHAADITGRSHVTLYKRVDSEPDDIAIHNATRTLIWTERGAAPAIYTAGLDGGNVKKIVYKRLRRATALAVYAPASRLYFVDATRGVIETTRLDGSSRYTIATFALEHNNTAAGTQNSVHEDATHDAAVTTVLSRACVRMAAWEEWVWCGAGRGVSRVPRRAGPARAPRPRAAPAPLSALTLLHSAAYATLPADVDPCRPHGMAACHASALCLRSTLPRGFTCLCPDGLVPREYSNESNFTCVIPRTPLESPAATQTNESATCTLACGPGTCARVAGLQKCACPPLYAGPQCRHYRCAHYCHNHRGKCVLDGNVTVSTPDELPPLKCICNRGYSGARCEVAAPAPAPPPSADCNTTYCVCTPPYNTAACAACARAGPCGARAACVVSAGRPRCEPHICSGFCLNGGTCSVPREGAAVCACAAGWAGERCQRPACVDAACAPPARAPSAPATPATPANTHRNTNTNKEPITDAECVPGWCSHGGRCARAGAGRVCACAGAWGGARCAVYVGHDHACAARACAPPALCVWGPDVSETETGPVYCACLEGTQCTPPPLAGQGAPAGAAGAAGAWIAALLVILSLAAIAGVAAMLFVHRRRQGAFVHARLADNVEISNPMYLAGEDEVEHHNHSNGGNHFANPVYESMYAPPQNNAPEEHATLLSTGEGSPAPAERAALL